VSEGVIVYEIGHEVFMLGGDSWELTDAASDTIGQTWPVLIHGRGARIESTCRGDLGLVDGTTR
jgi:hypothetical protein